MLRVPTAGPVAPLIRSLADYDATQLPSAISRCTKDRRSTDLQDAHDFQRLKKLVWIFGVRWRNWNRFWHLGLQNRKGPGKQDPMVPFHRPFEPWPCSLPESLRGDTIAGLTSRHRPAAHCPTAGTYAGTRSNHIQLQYTGIYCRCKDL